MKSTEKVICMIPARMGSQRLKKKNLCKLNGIPLITHAIRKANQVKYFDEIWINSEHDDFKRIANNENVLFHKRPPSLAENNATSEDFIYEFLKNHECKFLIQLHTIAPLLKIETIKKFTNEFIKNKSDVQLSIVEERIECSYNNIPVNFTITIKTISQELKPIQRITWSITGWNAKNYINVYESGECASFAGVNTFYAIDREEGLIIKTENDFKLVELFFNKTVN